MHFEVPLHYTPQINATNVYSIACVSHQKQSNRLLTLSKPLLNRSINKICLH